MASLPPITPAFAWAHPELPAAPPPSMKAKESPQQPVSNPLLKRASPLINGGQAPIGNGHKNIGGHSNGDSGVRLPFSLMDNNKSAVRQRRKPLDKAPLPPTTSLTEGSFYSDAATPERMENQPGTFDMVLWNNSNSSSDDSWEFWVLVFGFSSKAQYDEVLRRFESFGRIVSKRGGQSNWVSLRYESYLEAEKALCQQTCVLGDGTVMGVSRMDGKLSQTLDWDAHPKEVHSSLKSNQVTSALGEDDVLMSNEVVDGTKSSMCEKVLAFIFGWD